VLWLLRGPARGEAELRRQAEARGLTAGRLVFAPPQSHTDHLARLQLADLGLDSHPVTSHTTASDLLWAGVPLVTMAGDTFVSRVAASVVKSAGLPELVARDERGYFDLALHAATNARWLGEIRQRLVANRMDCPLFDSRRFTRDLERLYRRMWSDHRQGAKQHFLLTEHA
jgi:protein O-GlcNAc transferase